MKIEIDPDDLAPVIEQAVAASIARLEGTRFGDADKLAFREPEAARLLSLESHQLRDERLRGRIKASMGPGGKILYTRQNLIDYLASRPWRASA